MLKQFLGAIWRYLPRRVRYRLTRIGQQRFTVTTAAVIFDEEGRVLLLEHVFRRMGWGIPGGFLNSGEQPEEGLRRELREEIGVELTNVESLYVRGLRKLRQVEIHFRARVVGTPEPRSFEIKRAQWFAVDQLPPELSKDQRRLIDRALPREKCS